MPIRLDDRLPAALDYSVRDPKVIDLTHWESIQWHLDSLQRPYRLQSGMAGDVALTILELKRELEATAE